ncbi:MAG: secretin N-terminal domain-containing protein, partial [Gallionellaceae bacterium]|nr:secretin N-terminal domain-containing protein [Gallionellaceae bacterium]
MKSITLAITLIILLSACAAPNKRNTTAEAARQEMDAAAEGSNTPAKPDTVNRALLPPLEAAMPKVDSKSLEAKFDINVNSIPASQVFMAIVSGTRYSMLVHPDVTGAISLNLKDVTVFETLEAIRELYGYEYKVDATRIYVQPLSLQTRLFQVNYLTGQRAGTSSLRVSGGSVIDSAPGQTTGGTATPQPSATRAPDSSKVTMTSNSDFWAELSHSLNAIVGT